MLNVKGLSFSNSLGVLFALRENHGHKTLQETYRMLETTDLDIIYEVLLAAYNDAHLSAPVNEKEFVTVLADHQIGFIRMTEIFQELVEKLMFDGLAPEEVEAKKKFLMSLQK